MGDKDVIVLLAGERGEDLATSFPTQTYLALLAHFISAQHITLIPLCRLLKDTPHHLASPRRKHRKKSIAQLYRR
jgi:hypothetical protein